MPWIESHSELRDHPKSKRMKRKLRISEHETVGLLHYFWYWALEFAPDGDITNLSDEDIADGCRFTGEPEEFVSALIHAGFVDEIDGVRTIHDWFKHAGKLIAWRQKEAERARVNREKNGKKPVNTDSVHSTEGVRTEDDLRTNGGTYVPVTVTVTDTDIKDTTTDGFELVRTAYKDIHVVLDLPMQDCPILTKLLDDGITPELIIDVMKDKLKPGVRTIKYYVDAIRERHENKGIVPFKRMSKLDREMDILKRFREDGA